MEVAGRRGELIPGSLCGIAALEARVSALEAAAAAALAPMRKAISASKSGYVNIPQAESDKRWNKWATYLHLKVLKTCARVFNRKRGDFLPTSRAWFAANVRDDAGLHFSPREFDRWVSPRRTFPVGSRQDLRIRRAIEREIERLRTAGYYIGMPQVEIVAIHARVM